MNMRVPRMSATCLAHGHNETSNGQGKLPEGNVGRLTRFSGKFVGIGKRSVKTGKNISWTEEHTFMV